MRGAPAQTGLVTAATEPAPARASLGETLRSLPAGIQGMWVGIACIVLLVGSAAALRSLFSSNVGAAVGPVAPVTTGTSVAVPTAPSASVAIGGDTPKTASSPGALGTGPSAPALNGFGALAIRDRMSTSVRLRRFGPFLDDLEKLVELEPTALDRSDVRQMIVAVATYGTTMGPAGSLSPDADRLYKFLTGPAGAAGPDILFELVTTRGGSKAASISEELLKRDDIRARGTPALRIAWDLRAAPSCQAKVALFDRVKTDGDRRALTTLFQMQRCGHGPTDCCLSNDPGLKEVLRVLNTKK
jgi:hypothetical protein